MPIVTDNGRWTMEITFKIKRSFALCHRTAPSRVAESESQRCSKPAEGAYSRILGSSNADFCVMLTFGKLPKLPANCMFLEFGLITAPLRGPAGAQVRQIHSRIDGPDPHSASSSCFARLKMQAPPGTGRTAPPGSRSDSKSQFQPPPKSGDRREIWFRNSESYRRIWFFPISAPLYGRKAKPPVRF